MSYLPEIVWRLMEQLPELSQPPQTILEIGYKDQEVFARLTGQFPEAHYVGTCTQIEELMPAFTQVLADPQHLPFKKESVDLVVAHLTLPGLPYEAIFHQIYELLRPQGLFLFSSFGPDTAVKSPALPFVDMHHLGDALLQMQFTDPVVSSELLTFRYPDFARLQQHWQLLGYVPDPDLTATATPELDVEIIYGCACKKIHEYTIPVSAIGRKSK